MDVTLPDGTVIQGVPDGMSKADLTLKLKNNGYDVSKLEPAPASGRNRAQQKMDDVMSPAINYDGKDATGGILRGAGSIGTTIMRALPNFLGGDTSEESAARRANLDPSIAQFTGANPESVGYKTTKLATEVLGTAGIGGLLGKGAQAVGAAPSVVNALTTGGMTTGAKVVPGATNMLMDLGMRAGAGAVTGAASAGAIDPADAKTGAMIGGALPVAAKVLGAGGNALGKVLAGPEQTPEMLAAIRSARDAGYVIPPTQAKPSLGNRVLEGFSGKLTTAQNASAKNAEVTDALASKALGLPVNVKITPESLQDVRKTAGQAYEAIGSAGTITPGPAYQQALDKIASPHAQAAQGFPNAKASPVLDLVESLKSSSFDASSAVAKIKELRTAADDAFRAGNTDIGRASKSAATAIEDAIESHLQQSGQADLLKNFIDARQLIAKSYTVEKAMNSTTGTVDAKKLGAMLDKGKPLSDELKTAGDFANRFPKAAQTVEKMGSLPQNSPLDWHAAGAVGMATQNPLSLAGVMLRPAARSLALSSPIQNRLAMPRSQNQLAALLNSPESQQLLYRSAPVASGQ